jgi:hypothetical protein
MDNNDLDTVTTRGDIVNEGIALHGEIATPPQGTQQGDLDIFRNIVYPDDSYDADGTYWADMGYARRVGFVGRTDANEALKELRQIGKMMKKDPLSPISFYFRNYVIPGAGLGLEGRVFLSF